MRLRVVAFMIILALLCLAVLIRVVLTLSIESVVALVYCFAFLVVGIILGFVFRGVQGS